MITGFSQQFTVSTLNVVTAPDTPVVHNCIGGVLVSETQRSKVRLCNRETIAESSAHDKPHSVVPGTGPPTGATTRPHRPWFWFLLIKASTVSLSVSQHFKATCITAAKMFNRSGKSIHPWLRHCFIGTNRALTIVEPHVYLHTRVALIYDRSHVFPHAKVGDIHALLRNRSRTRIVKFACFVPILLVDRSQTLCQKKLNGSVGKTILFLIQGSRKLAVVTEVVSDDVQQYLAGVCCARDMPLFTVLCTVLLLAQLDSGKFQLLRDLPLIPTTISRPFVAGRDNLRRWSWREKSVNLERLGMAYGRP